MDNGVKKESVVTEDLKKRLAAAGKTRRAPAKPGKATAMRRRPQGSLVEVEDLEYGQQMDLKRRVEAANVRILADAKELQTTNYGFLRAGNVLAHYGSLERQIAAAKALLMRTACVAVALIVLAGCSDSRRTDQDAPAIGSAPASGPCVNGQCRAK